MLKLIDQRKDSNAGIAPVIRLELRCLREDLLIENIRVKDEAFNEKYLKLYGNRNRLAAAEAFIRNKLSEHGLEVGDIKEDYAKLILGTVTAAALRIDVDKK